MMGESGPVAFVKTDVGAFSDYNIINDDEKKQIIITAKDDSKIVDAKSDYSTALYELNDLKKEGFNGGIPARFLNKLPDTPDSSVEEGRIEDLLTIEFQQNMLYSLTSIAALTFLASVVVLAQK